MKEGGAKHAFILRELATRVAPGVSALTLEEEAMRLVREMGGKPAHLNYRPRGSTRPFPAVLCISVNEEIVHGIPNEVEKIFKEGDIVSIDLSFTYQGLTTDSAITVPVGAVDDETRELLRVAEEALQAGIEAAQPGNHIGDIGAAVSAVVGKSSFTLAQDLVGHGVGYDVHEDPYVPNVGKKGMGEKLVPGLVIAIEPMVNVGTGRIVDTDDGYTIKTADGKKSAHFEHTVAIMEKGNIILTK